MSCSTAAPNGSFNIQSTHSAASAVRALHENEIPLHSTLRLSDDTRKNEQNRKKKKGKKE